MNPDSPASVVALRLSVGELSAIVGIADTDQARTTAEKLKIDELAANDGALRLGLSSLIARGLADIDGESIVTRDEGTPIAKTFANAYGWVEIGLMSANSADGALIVISPDLAILCGAATGETYELVPLDPQVVIGASIAGIVLAFLGERSPAVASVQLSRGAIDKKLSVIHGASGSWELRTGDDGLLLAPGDGQLAVAEIRARLESLWPEAL